MKHIVLIIIFSISSALSADGPKVERMFKVSTQTFRKQEGLSIMNSPNLAVVTDEEMKKLMRPDLQKLQKCPDIEFNKFNEAQFALYQEKKDKIIEFPQGKSHFVSKINPGESRLIFSDNIVDCVGLFIWKATGPVVFSHLDTVKINQGLVGRLLDKLNTEQDKALFQVYLISGTYSENVRKIYSSLVESGFKVSGKAIFDMYFDGAQTRYIALSSVGSLSKSQLKKQSTQNIVDTFEKGQKRLMVPHVLAATLSDGKLYNMTEARGLVRIVKEGKSSQVEKFLEKMESIAPERKVSIMDHLKTLSPEEVLNFMENFKI